MIVVDEITKTQYRSDSKSTSASDSNYNYNLQTKK